jgi:ADP-heptose:LPS heptosyltransferase
VYGILLTEHIGDVIACEPVIGWAHDKAPNALVVWIIGTRYAELLQNHPRLDALFTVDSLAAIAPIIRSGVLDVAIDLHINRKPTDVPNVLHMKAWGDPSIDFDTFVREGSLLRALTKAAGIEQFSHAAHLYVPASAQAKVDSLGLPSRFVVVHPTSNDPTRDWSMDEWARLTQYIADDCRLPIVEIGLEPKIGQRPPSIVSVAGSLSIMETAEVIRRAAYFIGIDSGPAHMANALRTPSLILLGRFRGHDWCPYEGYFRERADARLLRHKEPVAALSAGAVIERLRGDHEWRVLAEEPRSPLA